MLDHRHARPTKPARAVVIGAGGFVGGAVVDALAGARVETLALGRKEVDLLAAGAGDRLAALLRPTDCVFAVSSIAPVKNTAMLADNMILLDAMTTAFAKARPAHIINIGSDAVFADEPRPLHEGSPRAPGSLHGVMHLAREVAFGDLGLPLATLRPTLIYGAADPHNGYGPNRFLRLAAAGKDIVLFGEGEERRDHVFIGNVADLAVRIALFGSTGSLNAATGMVWSFREVAETVAGLFEPRVHVQGTPRQGAMPHGGFRPFDASATGRAFPDFHYTSLPDGLKITRRALIPPA
jgi:nucleoside-diphosphate-sugar epimerase